MKQQSKFTLTSTLFFAVVAVAVINKTNFAQIEQEPETIAGYNDLKKKAVNLSSYIKLYRINRGEYPNSLGDLMSYLESTGDTNTNAVASFSLAIQGSKKSRRIPFRLYSKRPNGSSFDSPREKGTKDVIASSQFFADSLEGIGFFLVIWDDYTIQKVPYDEVVYTYDKDGEGKDFHFYQQAGYNALLEANHEESRLNGVVRTVISLVNKPTIKGDVISDNGGPESLIQLSRRMGLSAPYGVDREDLWKVFDPAKPEFTLADVQTGATKLGLETKVAKQTLSQTQKSGTSALLFLKDDGRIVTLTALDEDRAVVVDRGLTRNVERNVLEARYSGEALVPTKAVAQNTNIVVDNAVREIQLPSLEAEVPQQFTIRNTGQTPLTLQLEYPLLGVTESKLSKDTLAPGETATLDLKVKWRSILKAPTQNVLVSLQTSDPIVPRLQLAILLVPPKTPDAK